MTEQQVPLDVAAGFDRALGPAKRLVDGVRPEQWSNATPCAEWNVRALLNHLVGGFLRTTAQIRDQPLPDRSQDHLGDDPRAAFAAAAQATHDAFLQPGVMESVYPSPIGEVPGMVLVQIRILELLVHGWDLARATAQTPEMPEDLAEQALFLTRLQLEGQPRDGGPFAAERAAPAGAPPLDRLAAYLGREI